MKMNRCQAWYSPIGAMLTGIIAWSGWMPAIALAVAMPIAVSIQKSRRAAFLTALGYYAGASWPLMPGAKAFFGPNTTWLESAILWLTSSLLLALPFGIYWLKHLRQLGIFLALVAVTVPPIGIIGWASPLTASGVLFPGTAWLGLAATFFLCSSAFAFPRLLATIASLLFVIAHAAYHPPAPPASWLAIDTKCGSGFSASDPLREFKTAQIIQGIVRDSDRRVIVFPEMVVRRWNDAAKAFWEPTLIHLRQADKTILLGAGLSLSGCRKSYLNAVVILGSHPASPFIQRIPVPIAMWKLFSAKDGVPLRLLGTGTAMVADQRVAILICYEQLLIWPVITSALERPNILIGTANDYWAAGTPIPAIQNASLHAWARLFRLPYISASNT